MMGGAWLLAPAMLGAPEATRSQPANEPASVIWSTPASCPDATVLVEQVQLRLGRPLRAREMVVSGSVQPQDGGFLLRLETMVHGHVDARALWAEDCGVLTDAAALVIAVSIDAVDAATALRDAVGPRVDSTVEDRTSATRFAPAAGRRPRPEAPAPTDPKKSSRDPRRPAVFAAVEGGASIGPTPGPSGAVSLRGALSFGRFELHVGGLYVSPRTRATTNASVRVQLGAVGVHGCFQPLSGRVELPVCVGIESGAMRGDGLDVSGARTRHGLWLAAVAGVGLWAAVHSRVALGVRAEGAGGFVRPRFQLEQPGPVRELFTPGPVVARVLAGIRVRLGRA